MNEKVLPEKPEEKRGQGQINLLELLIEVLRERKGEKKTKLVEAME